MREALSCSDPSDMQSVKAFNPELMCQSEGLMRLQQHKGATGFIRVYNLPGIKHPLEQVHVFRETSALS